MNNDINELTAKLKAAALGATPGEWVMSDEYRLRIRDSDEKVIASAGYADDRQERMDATFIALANPANILALTEALEAAQSRIAELEESHAQAIHSRDHYKRIVDEGIRSLAEARTLTVKLPGGYAVRSGHPINEGVRGVMFPKDGGPWLSRFEVEHALECAGIKLQIEGE